MKPNILGAVFISSAAAVVLGSYEFVRSPSAVLFKAAYGASQLPLAMAIMPIAVFLAVYLYGWILSHLGSRKTLFVTTIGSGVLIFGCFIFIKLGYSWGSAVLYIFRQAYIVILIEQYWSFLNSTYGNDVAKKINGPIAGISSLGAISGGLILGHWVTSFGTQNMILAACVLLIPTAFLSDMAYRICGEPKPMAQEGHGKKGHLHLSLFKENPLLLILFIIVLTTQIYTTFIELTFENILQMKFPNVDAQTSYSALFFTKVNALAAVFQFVITPLLLTILSLNTIHVLIPLVHLSTSFWLLKNLSLTSVSLSFMIFKSMDYSLFRAAKEILYIPLSFDSRYRAKEMIDVFAYRFGKGITSLGITICQSVGVILTAFYPLGALFAAGIWLISAIPIYKHVGRKKL